MPMSLKKNYEIWNDSFDWTSKPDWIKNTVLNEIFWNFVLFPRINNFLTTDTILEIAPGYGRWTFFLKNYCKKLIVVDIAPKCIEVCKDRFKEYSHIEYFVNDGKSLDMIKDNSIDFVFSYDSLVHCHLDVFDAYLKNLKDKMKKNSIGFIHHLNLAEYDKLLDSKKIKYDKKDKLIEKSKKSTVNAKFFKQVCEKNNLSCITQELITWKDCYLANCMSTFTPKGSKFDFENCIIENEKFLDAESLEQNYLSPYIYKMKKN